MLTSAALAAALLAPSGGAGLEVPSPPADPSGRPGVPAIVCFFVTGTGRGASELEPRVWPGPEKLSSLLAEREQILPILTGGLQCDISASCAAWDKR